MHIAFQAADRESVERFHAAALGAGGRDNGPPGDREYHPGYYSAYVLDPDGTNVEAVYHGPVERSARSVVFTWELRDSPVRAAADRVRLDLGLKKYLEERRA